MCLREVCPLLSICSPETTILMPTKSITFNKVRFLHDRCWRCWHFPRHCIYPQLSQFCLSADIKHSLKLFCYHTDPSPEKIGSCNPKIGCSFSQTTILRAGPQLLSSSQTPRYLSDHPSLYQPTPHAKSRKLGAGEEAAIPFIRSGIVLQPFVRTSGNKQLHTTAHLHAYCFIATAFYALQHHLSLLSFFRLTHTLESRLQAFKPHVSYSVWCILQISP